MHDGVALLERGFSTKEVAAQLGFRDRSSLFRVFRLHLRHSPRRFVIDRQEQLLPEPRSLFKAVSQTATFLSQTATPSGLRLTATV